MSVICMDSRASIVRQAGTCSGQQMTVLINEQEEMARKLTAIRAHDRHSGGEGLAVCIHNKCPQCGNSLACGEKQSHATWQACKRESAVVLSKRVHFIRLKSSNTSTAEPVSC
jgi:hypothetical protein